ncbi:MAG: PBSX family phage terminase large subunit [Oscillospiraceae bacterium]|jgi:PBSX family phage terminase large subunit|nr:PBSX family phage terminase large subunit [Oscillospiraceae bacterium]
MMPNSVYTPKQLELLRLWRKGKLKHINILSGSVRSGKTWISLVLWAFWVASMPEDGTYLLAAKTLTSLRRNCLDLLQELVGTDNFTYSIPQKQARLFGRLIYLEGCNDARAESKIRGMTLHGAYCDELTQFTHEFFEMLLTRLSAPKAKLFATTNPDSPRHWLKEKYIDRRDELDILYLEYLIEDNTFLAQDFIDRQKAYHTGVFYERFILGRWVLAEGLIYPMQAQGHGVVPDDPERRYTRYFVSVDYGTVNPFSAGLWGYSNGVWYRIKEYYYDSRKKKHQRTDDEHYTGLCELIGDIYPESIIVDPSAASFIATIRKAGKYDVRKAKNDVVDGIRRVASAFSTGKIEVVDTCAGAIGEFGTYRWDEKSLKDEPIKEGDHAMDDIRYFVNTASEWFEV